MTKRQTTDLLMPRLGETMDEGTVVAWLIKPGEKYKRGQTLAEVETDKTIVELPALADGEMVEVIAAPGKKVAVGGVLAKVIEGRTKDHKATKPGKKQGKAKGPARKKAKATTMVAQGAPIASPNARRVARELGVNLSEATATGRRGRLTEADIRKAAGKAKAKKTSARPSGHSKIAIYHWPECKQVGNTPLLLIHGLFGNAAAWNGVAAILSHGGTGVYAIDLPGHGNSKSTLTEAKKIAFEVAATLRDSWDDQVRIAGLSLGAVVAAEIAAIDDRCVELMLVCPAGLGKTSNEDFIDSMLLAAKNKDGKLLDRQLAQHGVRLGKKAIDARIADMSTNAGQLEKLARSVFPNGSQATDITGTIANLGIPVRALFALDDKVFPWQDAANLPLNASAHFLPGAGHLPHMTDQDRLVEFLSLKN